ncbi:MAG: hypothetical protein LUC27_03935 [Lachnospiraceae bacterium]|nr:hypothetical protein [Lachnospiraceae bacterium]MCD8329825.1 hypothetical protein [Lachnospiraceae bacterium]
MIHVFVCPGCRAVRLVSRYRSASCLVCGTAMVPSEIPYLRWTELDEEERRRAAERQAEKARRTC